MEVVRSGGVEAKEVYALLLSECHSVPNRMTSFMILLLTTLKDSPQRMLSPKRSCH